LIVGEEEEEDEGLVRGRCTFELILPGCFHEEGHAAQEVDLGDEPILVDVEQLEQEPAWCNGAWSSRGL
jgi:hypothetical protein